MLVVYTEDLAPHLIEWRDEWIKNRPLDGMFPDGIHGGRIFLGHMQKLRLDSGVSEHTIHMVMRRARPTVLLNTADKLLCAIDREYLLDNGTIRVVDSRVIGR